MASSTRSYRVRGLSDAPDALKLPLVLFRRRFLPSGRNPFLVPERPRFSAALSTVTRVVVNYRRSFNLDLHTHKIVSGLGSIFHGTVGLVSHRLGAVMRSRHLMGDENPPASMLLSGVYKS